MGPTTSTPAHEERADTDGPVRLITWLSAVGAVFDLLTFLLLFDIWLHAAWVQRTRDARTPFEGDREPRVPQSVYGSRDWE